MKINFISKKMITLAIAGVVALTPLTACSYQTNEDGAVELVKNVSFDTLSSSRVVILKTKGDVKVYISSEHSDYSYNDILTDKIIYQISDSTEEVLPNYEGIELVCEESVMPYLLIYDYIKWGGLPLRFSFNREEDVRRYLETLFDQIVERDIKMKSPKFNVRVFKDISSYMMANAGKEFSAENIINYYKTNTGQNISRQTIYNYLEKMEKAYLIHSVEKYDVSGKKILKSNEKYYAIDPGFRIINTNSFDFEDTFFLENIIYNNLVAEGYYVRTGKLNNGEIDFVASKNGKKCFIQVAYLLASEKTITREFGAYEKVRDASPKYVMSLDKIDMSRDGIIHLNILDYLLKEKELILT